MARAGGRMTTAVRLHLILARRQPTVSLCEHCSWKRPLGPVTASLFLCMCVCVCVCACVCVHKSGHWGPCLSAIVCVRDAQAGFQTQACVQPNATALPVLPKAQT